MNNYFPAVSLPTYSSSLPVSNSNNFIDPYKIARGEQYVDPQLFQLYLTASMTNIDSLFGDDDKEDSDDVFGNSSLFSQSTFGTSKTIYEEMIARAGLIGKTVDAIDPTTNQIFTGKVNGVTVESGNLQIIIDGRSLPPENLRSIKE